MTHSQVVIGKIYKHFCVGSDWDVSVTAIFQDGHRWAWEGVIKGYTAGVQSELIEQPCWGWVSELREVK
jgi:hypothetical protein